MNIPGPSAPEDWQRAEIYGDRGVTDFVSAGPALLACGK